MSKTKAKPFRGTLSILLMQVFLITTLVMFNPMIQSIYADPGKLPFAALDQIEFGAPVDYSNVLFRTDVVSNTMTMQDGVPVMLTVVGGAVTILNVVNMNTGELINYYELAGETSTSWNLDTDSKGDVYFGTYAQANYYKYSPETKQLTSFGSIMGESAAICQAFDDENGHVYIGTYPNARLLRLDKANGTFIDMGKGPVFPTAQYLSSVAYYYGKIYVASEYAYEIKILNVHDGTLESTISYTAIPLDTIARNGLYIRGNKLVVLGNTGGLDAMAVMDLEDGTWSEAITGVTGLTVTPLEGNVFRFIKNRVFHEYNIETGGYESTYVPWGTYLRGRGPMLEINNPNFTGLSGLSYVTTQFNGRIHIFNFNTNVERSIDDVLQGTPSETWQIAFGPEDRLYVGEAMGTKAAALDLDTGDVEIFHMGQPDGMAFMGDMMYFGDYRNGSGLYILDTTKPYSRYNTPSNPNNNPRILYNIAPNHGRPYFLLPVPEINRLFIGGTPAYGIAGSPLSVYNPDTDAFMNYDHGVTEQTVAAMAWRDGKLYFGTNVSPGLGATTSQADTYMCVFDWETKQVTQRVKLVVPGIIGSIKYIPALAFDDEGSLWGVAQGIIFKLAPDTLEVLGSRVVSDYDFRGQQHWWPQFFHFDEETGLIITSANNELIVMDPVTMAYKKTEPFTGSRLSMTGTVGPDGNIYFTDDGFRITMLPVTRSKPEADVLNKLILTPGDMTRSSNRIASVKFTSNKVGTYYYQLDGVPPADAQTLVNTKSNLSTMIAAEQTIPLLSLAAGAHTIYIVGKDTTGHVSNLLSIVIPVYLPSDANLLSSAKQTIRAIGNGAVITSPQKARIAGIIGNTWYGFLRIGR